MLWSQRPPAPRRRHRNIHHLSGSQPLQIALGGVPPKILAPMDLDVDVPHNLAQDGRKLWQIPIYDVKFQLGQNPDHDVKFQFLLDALGPFGIMGNHPSIYPQLQRLSIWKDYIILDQVTKGFKWPCQNNQDQPTTFRSSLVGIPDGSHYSVIQCRSAAT